MKNLVHIQAKLVWKWGRTRNGHYVAVCDAISQTVQADKFDELLETMNEALDSTFRELLSSGDLNQFLQSRGWKSLDLPEPASRKNIRFDVPYDLQGVRSHDLQAALCQ